MTPIDAARAQLAAAQAKLDAATDESSRWYYQQCMAGWRKWLAKCQRATSHSPE